MQQIKNKEKKRKKIKNQTTSSTSFQNTMMKKISFRNSKLIWTMVRYLHQRNKNNTISLKQSVLRTKEKPTS